MSGYTFNYILSIYTGRNQLVDFDGYRKRADKIEVCCPVHGSFMQAISSVLNNTGCRQCYFDSLKGGRKYTTESWVEKAKKIHNNFYDYTKSIYTGAEDKISITCPVHGDFLQAANVHLAGSGCRKCSTQKMVDVKSFNTETYIQAANIKHDNKYSYASTIFTNIRDKVTIICPIHGEFQQVAYYHTAGNGCPVCGITNTTYKSAPEYEIIDFIKELGISNIIHSSRHLGFELDIFLPEYNIAIEYNGLYWHSSHSKETDKKYSVLHVNKTNICEKNGIKLFHIFENEWLDTSKKIIWKSMLRNAVKKSERIYARLCKVSLLTNVEAIKFCNDNHMQGGINSSNAYGLFHNTKLVSVITIGKSRYSTKQCTEIYRFCNLINTTVIGGFSKLLSHIKKTTYGDIISYANRRWSQGNLYEKAGFFLANISGPCYFYIERTSVLHHRSVFTKKNVLKKFPGSSGSEVSIMYDNKYRRIWDSGNLVYKLQNENKNEK